MFKQNKGMVGIECPLCHEEVFRLVPREVTHEVGVCPRCANRIDAKQEEQTIRDATKVMEKSERKQYLRELSLGWASKLHGKKVIVYWDDNTHPTLTTYYEKQIKGVAYRTTNECGGWGNVKVIIDPTEHNRITVGCDYTLFCKIAGKDMFFTSAPLPLQCWGIKCQHQRSIIDGQRFGLFLKVENGSYYTLVSWGCRKTIVMDEN